MIEASCTHRTLKEGIDGIFVLSERALPSVLTLMLPPVIVNVPFIVPNKN